MKKRINIKLVVDGVPVSLIEAQFATKFVFKNRKQYADKSAVQLAFIDCIRKFREVKNNA